MTETDRATKRYAETQLTWCITRNGYADESFGCPDATDHDHYDLVVDQHGKALFRVWPIGTTFLTDGGITMRLRGYDTAFEDMIAAEERGDDPKGVPPRPRWDGWTADGGAFGEGSWLPDWFAYPVTYVLGDARPAPGALFVRPNGEAWRLRSYSTDWTEEPFTGKHTKPSWSVNLVGGASTAGDVLPADARPVFLP